MSTATRAVKFLSTDNFGPEELDQSSKPRAGAIEKLTSVTNGGDMLRKWIDKDDPPFPPFAERDNREAFAAQYEEDVLKKDRVQAGAGVAVKAYNHTPNPMKGRP